MMLKKLLQRAVVGFSATALIQMIVMFIIAQCGGSPVTKEFSACFSSDMAAVMVQLLLCCLIGVAFACAAALFEIERWSYLLQGAVHFAVTAAVWMPIMWICWRPTNAVTSLYAALGWLLTYVINWFVQFLIYRNGIKKLNASIASFSVEESGNE